jgi:hypothetical protein
MCQDIGRPKVKLLSKILTKKLVRFVNVEHQVVRPLGSDVGDR